MDVTAPGRELHSRFIGLGDLTGKTAEQIIAVVGPPTSRSFMAHNQVLLQWQATGCHMALLFDGEGRFLKITHEYARYAPPPTGCLTIVALVFLTLATLAAFAIRSAQAHKSQLPAHHQQSSALVYSRL